MKIFVGGLDHFQEKARRMIAIHEMETGKKPEVINIDLMPITFNGVRVEFAKCGDYSAHDGKVIHYKFVEDKQ